MPMPITVPRLGWNMEQGTFAGWLKADGAAVRAGEPLFRLESDKATEEVDSLDAGTLHIPPDGPRPGDVLAVGTVIGHLLAAGETAPSPPVPLSHQGRGGDRQRRAGGVSPLLASQQGADAPRSPEGPAGPSARRLARRHGVDLAAVTGTGRGGRITPEDVARSAPRPGGRRASSPRARRVAAELGVDWTRLTGSGRGGRVRERDVRAAAPKAVPVPKAADSTLVPLTPVRRTIAERMLRSRQTTAPVTLTTTADATNLVNLRRQFQAAEAAGAGPPPGYTDFLVKLAAVALRKHPALNARWEDDGIRLLDAVNVGIAVDTDAGLLVPVLRDVPALSVGQVAERARDLIARARERRLTAAELQGGTFTVTNLGGFGIETFTPILNAPECAILGVGRIQRQPVAVGDAVAVRDRIGLSVTFDHRLVDGAPAARFVQTLVALIENPVPWLLG